MRYSLIKTKKIKDSRGRLFNDYEKNLPIPKRLVYNTLVYPKIPRDSEDVFIETRLGDRFDLLANEFYGNVNLWWIIAKANDMVYGSLAVGHSVVLRIPIHHEKILQDFNAINEDRQEEIE